MGDVIRAVEHTGSLAERESDIEATEARLHIAHLAALELDRAYRLAGLIHWQGARASVEPSSAPSHSGSASVRHARRIRSNTFGPATDVRQPDGTWCTREE